VTLVPDALRVLRNSRRLTHSCDVSRINDVLRDELWKGQGGTEVSAVLTTAGIAGAHQSKVSLWRKDREPSLDMLAQIESAYGVPRGWVLWRAGYIDIDALQAHGNAEPAPVAVSTLNDVSSRLDALERKLEMLSDELRRS